MWAVVLCSELLKKTEMGRACGTHGVDERCIQDFSGEG
jgi:hypothetical protein